MNTIADTITIANITIAIIPIAIITISPGPNAHTYAHNLWEASSRFRLKIWAGDLLSPWTNCLPFLQNLRLQVSTPWSWGIVRFRLGGHSKVKIQTLIQTDVMISAACHLLPATCHMQHASHQTLLATRHQPHTSRCGATAEVDGREPIVTTLPHLSWHSKGNSWESAVLPRGV